MNSQQSAAPEQLAPVAKSVTVPVTVSEAFEVFTRRPSEWWPAGHVLVGGRREAVVFEPFTGGRWFERAEGGAERDWGRVVSWDPPRSLVLTWRIDARWQPIDDDERASEIAVFFEPADTHSTRVELVHRALDRHGPGGAAIRAAIDGPSPGETLSVYRDLILADALRR